VFQAIEHREQVTQAAPETIEFPDKQRVARLQSLEATEKGRRLARDCALSRSVNMRSEISGDMAVGALIEGAVMETVAMNGSGVIPAGSRVQERLRRMEHYTYPISYFVIALEFTEIRNRGTRDSAPILRRPGRHRWFARDRTNTVYSGEH
jgi:hypothetical protein